MLARMVRFIITTCLIICTGWQSLAFAGFAALVADEDRKQHELLHFEGVAHHHDAHGDHFHQDDSLASTIHVLSDAGQFAPVLPSQQGSLPGMPGSEQPTADYLTSRALMMPNGLDRPPKRST